MSRPVGLVAVGLAGALVAACSASGPHGNPDPGGKRLAEMAHVARVALPSGAVLTDLSLTKSAWGRGGCDGGPPGWTNMKAVELFRAPGDVVADVNANMRRLGWRAVSKTNSSPANQVPTAAPGSAAPWAQEYRPTSDPSEPVAWLYTPAQAGGSRWELDVIVGPAEVPDHAC